MSVPEAFPQLACGRPCAILRNSMLQLPSTAQLLSSHRPLHGRTNRSQTAALPSPGQNIAPHLLILTLRRPVSPGTSQT
eukprot:10560716-Lingulodinium_polyedra.AAC.1